MKLVNNEGMQAIDRLAQEKYGIPADILMENAGIRLWDALVNELCPDLEAPIVFVAGSGNNAGDALVMARQAWNRGYRNISIVSLKQDPGGLAGRWLKVAAKIGIPLLSEPGDEEFSRHLQAQSILVDGITGTGIRGPLRPETARVVERIAALEGLTVVAVDAPSGIGDTFTQGDPVLGADITLSVAPLKRALYSPAARPFCGRIVPVEIGFPDGAVTEVEGSILMDEAEVRQSLAPFPASSYKNRRGHLAVRAGSPGTTGAGLLAAEAAARSGAGLVSLFLDPDLSLEGFSAPRAVMLHCTEEALAALLADAGSRDVLLLGPGWGLEAREREFSSLTAAFSRGVIDADGLALLAEKKATLSGEWILTPHPGECSRMLDIPKEEVMSDPWAAARETARRFRATVILKGHVSVIVDENGREAVVDGMNPALATGGSGDILAGMVAGLLCDKRLSPFDAAAAAVYLHQAAGRQALKERGNFIADDLFAHISHTLGAYRYAGT